MFAVARRAWHQVTRPFTTQNPTRRLHAQIARRYLAGSGLEIGALHNPLPLPRAATVLYVDRMANSELRQHYPDLADHLVDVDVIEDGETLATIADGSQDFLIANHFLEHTEDPIGTLKRFVAVLRPGGTLYLTLPDKRYTFDKPRPITPLQHLWDDHRHGPQWSRRQHFEEYAAAVHSLRDSADIARHADHYHAANYSIHFHVWDQPAMRELFAALKPELGYDVLLERPNAHEVIFVLRKRSEW